MLNKETFTKGITIIQKIFLNWSFNSKDMLQMQLWYKALETLEDDEFMKLIETYCKTRIHAPNSPNDFLLILAEEEEKKYPNPHEAFTKVRELINDYGWSYGRSDIYKAIENNPALTETVREMEPDLRELTINDTFTPKVFRDLYAVKLKTMCLKNRDAKLKALKAPVDIKSIGKGMPYEE